jgi:hypothetical protein
MLSDPNSVILPNIIPSAILLYVILLDAILTNAILLLNGTKHLGVV